MSVLPYITKHIIQPWLPRNLAISDHQSASNQFVVSILICAFIYTCFVIVAGHFLIPLEPLGKKLTLYFSYILSGGIFLALLAIRIGGHRVFAINIFLTALCIGFLLVCLQTGGLSSPSALPAVAIPALATLSIGTIAGIIWGSIIMFAGAGIFIFSINNYRFTNIIAPQNLEIAHLASLWTAISLILFIAIYFDLSSRRLRRLLRKENAKFIQLANHDSLTGLANRRYFISHATGLIEEPKSPKKFCIFYFDLNNFKEINDQYGHHCGDYVLKEFSSRLSQLSRNGDFIARLGGDEFCMIIPDLNDENIINNKIKTFSYALAAPIILENTLRQVPASIGYAIYPQDGIDFQALLRVADKNMYSVKNSPGTTSDSRQINTTSTRSRH